MGPFGTLDLLDADTRRTLAALHGAPDDVAELAIGTLGHWVRVVLAEAGVIERMAPERGTPAAARGRPAPVVLTEHGREVLAACAEAVGARPEVAARMRELRKERNAAGGDGEVA